MKKISVGLMVLVPLLWIGLAACSTEKGLDATNWKLASYRDSEGEMVDVLPESVVTADFQADQVSGMASCNRYSGTYQITGSEIDFGPLASTMMMCIEPRGIMEQEAAFLAAMEAAARFDLKGNTLEMMDDRGDTILVFKSATSE